MRIPSYEDPQRSEVLIEMATTGGSFVSHIAKAWMVADSINIRKLDVAFGNYYDEYRQQLRDRELQRQAIEDRKAAEGGPR